MEANSWKVPEVKATRIIEREKRCEIDLQGAIIRPPRILCISFQLHSIFPASVFLLREHLAILKSLAYNRRGTRILPSRVDSLEIRINSFRLSFRVAGCHYGGHFKLRRLPGDLINGYFVSTFVNRRRFVTQHFDTMIRGNHREYTCTIFSLFFV